MEFLTPLRPDTTSSLGMALVMSSPTPLVLLDENLQIHAASGSFCRSFSLALGHTIGRSIFALGDGEWNIPQLRSLLDAVVAGREAIESYEIDLVRQKQETLKLILSAHLLNLPIGEKRYIALAVCDVTEARKAERIKDDLVREKQLLWLELQHRVANSLQIIASVLMQSVRRVQSEETRTHLRDAHNRVMSVATLQRQLALSDSTDVAIGPYFTDLCSSIGASMIGDPAAIRLTVHTDATVTSSAVSVSLGLIVTELVINCLKHAFPEDGRGGTIEVDYRSAPTGWSLTVSDSGVGLVAGFDPAKAGLGTGIVNALAKQLQAKVTISDNGPGTQVAITCNL
ncbi:histidine kinase [Novosphingobium flavum]|uniref:histidine kinase n=1 Tax=Novosphingobium flavum TaxID=1778672 RepID=A0A7X1FT68_9SPHN|nr:PAS domain-containing sensor histidine kinase [Novosphingobium flavum]MBC2666535.1 histidine kinase [Novosphingobium flavum]